MATIEFAGEKLSSEDFDAMAEYVELFKKQYQRKQERQNESDKEAADQVS